MTSGCCDQLTVAARYVKRRSPCTPTVSAWHSVSGRILHEDAIEVRLSEVDGKVDSKGMWAAVRQFTGQRHVIDWVTAVSMNHHYTPLFRQIQLINTQIHGRCLTRSTYRNGQYSNYWILLSARLPQVSINYRRGSSESVPHSAGHSPGVTSIVLNQWKAAYTRPVPKVTTAESHTDLRPISVTPVLSRMIENTVVRHYSSIPVSKQPTTDLGFL